MTQPIDPFDELAELFLTEPEQLPQYPTKLNNKKTIIELVVIGHLPVRAGVWLTPYADAIAREEGPTALLRMESDSATLQLIRAQRPSPSPPADNSTLDEGIAQIASAADTWIVRPPPSTPISQLVLASADRLTILSSADEAAVVAAYQIAKELFEAAEKADCKLPDLNLAVLGSDRHAAERMRQRLNRTTNTFLGIELQMVACIGHMDATIRSIDFGKYRDLPDRKLDSLLGVIDEAVSNAPEQHPTLHELADEPEIARPFHKAPPLSIIQQIAQPLNAPPVDIPRDDVEIPREAEKIEPPQTASVASTEEVKLSPKPAINVEIKQSDLPKEPDDHGLPIPLANYVEGVTNLPGIRCPDHEAVEIGIDKRGRINLLAREIKLRDLRIVEAWAKAHREIIAMACPDHQFDPSGKTISHVFTDTPTKVADMYATDIRLYVLAPVTVQDKIGWYAAPLNKPKR